MTLLDLLDSLAGRIVAWTAAVGAVCWLAGRIWKMFKRVDAILRGVKWIEAEMKPNGGNSFRDEFNKLREQFTAHLADHAKPTTVVNVASPAPVSAAVASGQDGNP